MAEVAPSYNYKLLKNFLECGKGTFYRTSFQASSIPRGVYWIKMGLLCCCEWAKESTKLHDVYGADIWMDAISTNSQFRKFMNEHSAKSVIIRQLLHCLDKCSTNSANGPMTAHEFLACLSVINRVIISYLLICTQYILYMCY